MTTPACSLCDAPEVRPRRHLTSDENGRTICQSCVEAGVRAYHKGGVSLTIPPAPAPPNQCALCAGDTSVGATYRSDLRRAVCQACVEKAVRAHVAGGVRLDVPAPPLPLDRCALCGRIQENGVFFVTNPPLGSACGPCIEECMALVEERRGDIAFDEAASPDTPTTPAEVRNLVRRLVRPELPSEAEYSARQQEILVRWLTPSAGGGPAPSVSADEVAQLLPDYLRFREYIEERLAPVGARMKEQEREHHNRRLAPSDYAAMLEQAIPVFIRPLGAAGTGPALFGSFLSRLVEQVRNGGPHEVRDILPVLFAPELRSPEINGGAADPKSDGLFINSLVRPTLARLKASANAVSSHDGRPYFVHLIIEGAERSKGPVKLPYRIAVLFSQSHGGTLASPSERPLLLRLLERALASDVLDGRVRVDALGPFAPIVENAIRAVALETRLTPGRLQLAATMLTLRALLALVTDDEKTDVLRTVLGLDVAGFPPPLSWMPGATFDDWFLDKVRIPPRDNPKADASFLRALRLRDSLLFHEKLLYLAAYSHSDPDRRAELAGAIERPIRFGASATPAPSTPFDLTSTLNLRVSQPRDLLSIFSRYLSVNLKNEADALSALRDSPSA